MILIGWLHLGQDNENTSKILAKWPMKKCPWDTSELNKLRLINHNPIILIIVSFLSLILIYATHL